MADATVNIIIKATDRADKVLEGMRKDLTEAAVSMDRLKTKTKQLSDVAAQNAEKTKGLAKNWADFKNQVPGLDRALSLLTNPITLVGAGLVAIGKFVKDSFNEFIAGADQVRDFSRALGTTAEASSALIQVADDLFVSYDTLKLSMKSAMKQGITPNIESLMTLASKYQTIQDPAARAAFAMKMFGKAGMEMTKILEKTPEQLQAMSDSLEGSSLIMSQQSVDAAYKYKQQMDALGDTLTEVKYIVGEDLLPEILKVNEALLEGVTVMRTDNIARVAYNKLLSYGAIKQEEYNKALQGGVKPQDMMLGGMTKTGEAVVLTAESYEKANALLKEYRDSTMDARDRIAAIIPAIDEETKAMEDLETATEKAARIQDFLKDKLSDLQSYIAGPLRNEAQSYLKDQANINGKMTETGAKIDEVKGKIDELEGKSYLTEAQKEQLEGYKTDLGDLQEDYTNLTGEITSNATAHDLATKKILFNLMTQSAAVDGLTGSEIATLDAVAVKWGLIDQATLISSQNIDAAFLAMANGAGIQETIGKLTDIGNIVNDIPKNVEINIHTTYTESGAPLPTNPKSPTKPRRALGGPVSAGREYLIGERGPEMFIPSQNGRIIPNVTNNYGSNDNSAVVAAIASLRAEFRNMPRLLRDQLAKVG